MTPPLYIDTSIFVKITVRWLLACAPSGGTSGERTGWLNDEHTRGHDASLTSPGAFVWLVLSCLVLKRTVCLTRDGPGT